MPIINTNQTQKSKCLLIRLTSPYYRFMIVIFFINQKVFRDNNDEYGDRYAKRISAY